MGLACLYGMLSSVEVMDIRWDELEIDVPLLLDYAPIVSTGFVAKDL